MCQGVHGADRTAQQSALRIRGAEKTAPGAYPIGTAMMVRLLQGRLSCPRSSLFSPRDKNLHSLQSSQMRVRICEQCTTCAALKVSRRLLIGSTVSLRISCVLESLRRELQKRNQSDAGGEEK